MIIKKHTETICKIILPVGHEDWNAIWGYKELNEIYDHRIHGWRINNVIEILTDSNLIEFLKKDQSSAYEFYEEGDI
jgi:hypothetical protein